MLAKHIDECLLIEKAKFGNEVAINQLLCQYYPKILAQIKGKIGDGATARDLAQEVCIRIFRYLTQFNQHAHLSTWIYRITQNIIKNYYRDCKNESFLEFQNQYEINAYNDPGPEAYLIEWQLSEKMIRTFKKIPYKIRCCLRLHIDGLSYEDISNILGCPLGTVRSRIHRAKDILRLSLIDRKKN